MDEFENEVREALRPRQAPDGFKQRLMARRAAQLRPAVYGQAGRRQTAHAWMMRAAAVLVMASLLGGTALRMRQKEEEHRRGEQARRQVLTALRITGTTLNRVNTTLSAHVRGAGD